jgi:hypothetical protein
VRVRGGLADDADSRRAGAELPTLPQSAAEVASARKRLDRARRHLFADEPGAAARELLLLVSSLRWADRRARA